MEPFADRVAQSHLLFLDRVLVGFVRRLLAGLVHRGGYLGLVVVLQPLEGLVVHVAVVGLVAVAAVVVALLVGVAVAVAFPC